MPEVFDPYHRWLGIPPEKQPPNHYALLGLAPLESDPDVIDSAADQRMAHLRTFQSGRHAEESQKLLNEVAAARICLLDPEKKAAYDEELRRNTLADARIRTGRPAARRSKLGPIVAASALGGLAVIVLLALIFRGDDSPSDDLAANTEVNEPRPEQPAGEPRPSEPSADAGRTPNDAPTSSTESEPDDRRTLVGLLEEPPADATPPDEPSQADPSEPDSESPVESRPRLPLPSQEAQDKVLGELAELYQFAALETAREKLQLAGELLALSRQSQDPAEQFVLRRKAMELAEEGGDAALMLQAIDAVAADFEIDALDVKQKTLVSFAGAGGDSKRIASLVANGLPVVDEALMAARYEEAFAILDATLRASQRSANRDDRKRVYDRNKQLADLQQAWQRFRQALSALESDADDAQAHLIAGRWYCFYQSDWEKGLPHLAEGSDQPLCSAAEKDLADPADPEAQIAAADAWWDLAESAQDEAKDAQLLRAGVWYKKALPNVTSVLDKHKLTQALKQIAKVERPSTEVAGSDRTEPQPPSQASGEITHGQWVDVLKAVDVDKDRVAGAWTRTGEVVTAAGQERSSLMLPVRLEGSYELAVEFTSQPAHEANQFVGIVLPAGLGQCLLVLGWDKGSGLEMIDGSGVTKNPTTRKLGVLQAGRRHTALVRVELAGEDAAIGVSLNGIGIIRWTGKQTSLSNNWAQSEPNRLGLEARGMATVFHSVRLRLLSGKADWVQPGEGTTNGEFTPHLPDPIMPPPDESAATPPAESRVTPGVAAIRQAKRGAPVRVVAAGCNGHEIFLNGIPLMKCSREKPTSAAGILKEGDVLAVKLGDRFDVMSLWMIFLTPRGEYLFETSDEWIGYLPLDRRRWWDPRGVRPGAQKAEYAPDTRQYVDRVKTAAQQGVPNLPKSQPVYSPLQGEERYSDAYLYYVVKVDDLIAKKPPASGVDKPGATTEEPDPEPSGEASGPGLTPAIMAPVAADVPGDSARVVNLLEKVNPGEYAVEGQGQWEYAEGILSVRGGSPARISFPYSPPKEYDYIVEFTPVDALTCVGLLVSRGDAPFVWSLNTRGQMARLESINGHAVKGNPTVRRYAFEGGKKYVAEVRVRDSGVTCLINGQVVLEEYQTDYTNLSRSGAWTMPNQRLLGVGMWTHSATFHRVEVREISGQGAWEAEK